MVYVSLSVEELLDLLGAATPTPASGTAAAIVGALAASLAELAAGVSGDEGAVSEARSLRGRFSVLADEDAEAYTAFLVSRSNEARVRIVEVPQAIAAAAGEVAALGRRLAREGKPSVSGDALAAVDLAEGAAGAAARLVELN